MQTTEPSALRPIEDLTEAEELFSDWSRLVRRLQPAFPEAIVHAIDAGHDRQPSVVITADTRTLEEGDIMLVLAKDWLFSQPELQNRLRQYEESKRNA